MLLIYWHLKPSVFVQLTHGYAPKEDSRLKQGVYEHTSPSTAFAWSGLQQRLYPMALDL